MSNKYVAYYIGANKKCSINIVCYYRSAGTAPQSQIDAILMDTSREGKGKSVDQELIDWADFIFVMEEVHLKFLRYKYQIADNKQTFVLYIPDEYDRNETKLKRLIIEAVEKFFRNNGREPPYAQDS